MQRGNVEEEKWGGLFSMIQKHYKAIIIRTAQ